MHKRTYGIACACFSFCSFLYEALHALPRAPSILFEVLFWLWGRAWGIAVSLGQSARCKKLATLAAKHQITWSEYSRLSLRSPCAVYAKVSLQYKHMYIGSTSCSVLGREGTRRRKFRQDDLSSAEPAIHWWRKMDDFFWFCPIVLLCTDSKLEAEMQETKHIERMQPHSNTPWVSRLLHIRREHTCKKCVKGGRLIARARDVCMQIHLNG